MPNQPVVKPAKRPRKRVSMRLNEELVNKATQLAEADHRSFSQYVERLLAQHLETQERLLAEQGALHQAIVSVKS